MKNSGPFYSRFVGLVFSKGKYIAFADSHDFFLPDFLGNVYNDGIKNKVEIVQWSIFVGYSDGKFQKGTEFHTPDVILNANILKFYMFNEHHENYPCLENAFVWDKIYKRVLLLRTMHKFHDDLINDHPLVHENNLFLFIIFQNANTYYCIDQYEYYWYRGHPTSTTNNYKYAENANKSFLDIFKNLKFIFNYTPDEEKSKVMCLADFEFFMSLHGHKLKFITEGFEFMKEVLNLYLSCKFYNEKQKQILMNVMNIFNENQSILSRKEK